MPVRLQLVFLEAPAEQPSSAKIVIVHRNRAQALLIARHRPLGSAYRAGASTVPSIAIDNSPLKIHATPAFHLSGKKVLAIMTEQFVYRLYKFVSGDILTRRRR